MMLITGKTKTNSQKKICFSNCHIIGLDNGSQVLIVFGINLNVSVFAVFDLSALFSHTVLWQCGLRMNLRIHNNDGTRSEDGNPMHLRSFIIKS
jgi:hypothetical protein